MYNNIVKNSGASGETADTHGSGPCVRKDVRVQIPPRPNYWQKREKRNQKRVGRGAERKRKQCVENKKLFFVLNITGIMPYTIVP